MNRTACLVFLALVTQLGQLPRTWAGEKEPEKESETPAPSRKEEPGSPKKKPDAVILKDVVVTASRTEILAREVPDSITVLSAEDIRLRGDLSIQDAMRSVPAIHVVQSGGRGRTTSRRAPP